VLSRYVEESYAAEPLADGTSAGASLRVPAVLAWLRSDSATT
jgi:hypothetical protein